ncbi:hypothetical protein F0562_018349 [Nyssa sinensis]|uniref:Ionotropic glutamate receptor C-terminal domain-containing protein n=1 Tax=Nyssa sinensis TaxID=561372 RepID=A0A5J4Z9S8_9ASTE|nr:hypothetical protein F0562_018349 [Nyssa sinensis]
MGDDKRLDSLLENKDNLKIKGIGGKTNEDKGKECGVTIKDGDFSFEEVVKGMKNKENSEQTIKGEASENGWLYRSLIAKLPPFQSMDSINEAFIPEDIFNIEAKYLGGLWVILTFDSEQFMNELLMEESWWLKKAAVGCERPAVGDKMIIGVPGRPFSDKFVKVESNSNSDNQNASGFCIRVFDEVQSILNIFDKPIHYVEYNGSYDDLVDCVARKNFDAVVGDVTIIADRWDRVDFTVPFIESGLSMVVPVKQTPKAWVFLMPFTVEMWGATGVILMYTMFIVWFLEHRSNPEEFGGKWKDQLGNVLWFTFSSLFFAHREKIRSNYTRVVIVVWLFVVLILTQSYTANLSSMLTIGRLQPIVEDVEWLQKSNATVGCAGNTFVRKYLVDLRKFEPNNIVDITSPHDSLGDYLKVFESGNISAALLETPYAKVFVNRHCKQYTVTQLSYRFGGFGFVFPKGSHMTTNVSEAILKLSENGKLKELEEDLFASSPECSNSQTTRNDNSLSLESFLGLYLLSGATSTICFLLFIIHLLKNYRRHRVAQETHIGPSDGSVWNHTIGFAQYYYGTEPRTVLTSHPLPHDIEMP